MTICDGGGDEIKCALWLKWLLTGTDYSYGGCVSGGVFANWRVTFLLRFWACACEWLSHLGHFTNALSLLQTACNVSMACACGIRDTEHSIICMNTKLLH